ncbi:hypothetical protein [Paraburkholderia sp. MM5482-R1]|uniref:hypothetical protein n=1 Tax=unclassified Paraburkholderia TaxID=2615204 RepID=UPI003D1B63A0
MDQFQQLNAAILLGATDFPQFLSLPRVAEFATASRMFRHYLLSPLGLGVSPRNVLDLFNSHENNTTQINAVERLVHRMQETSRSTNHILNIFVHYVGYAAVDQDKVSLCIAATKEKYIALTSLGLDALSSVIYRSAPQSQRFFILDARVGRGAAMGMATWNGPFHTLKPLKGEVVLTPPSEYSFRSVPEDEGTLFTTFLVKALVRGKENGHDYLTLNEVLEVVEDYGLEHYPRFRPEKNFQHGDTAAEARVFRNAAAARHSLATDIDRDVAAEKIKSWKLEEHSIPRNPSTLRALAKSFVERLRRGLRAVPLGTKYSSPRSPATLENDNNEGASRFVLLELSARIHKRWEHASSSIQPSSKYRAAIFIGQNRDSVLAPEHPFDETELPVAEIEHPLTVVFTPLWHDADGSPAAPQARTIVLPRIGDSSRAVFDFKSPAPLISTMARIIVLHQNRILQTLLLTADIKRDGTARLELAVESIVSSDFGEKTVSPKFDAALLVNDSPLGGSTALTAITPSSATFFVPEGLDILLSDIRNDLSTLNVAADEDSESIASLDDDRMCSLLHSLAMRGAALAITLKRQTQMEPFLAAPRIQVIEGASGQYFPIEFVYNGRAPMKGAKRCTNAIAALRDLSVHATCPNRDDAEWVCPAAFWGFSRCIERQPTDGRLEYRLSQPLLERDYLQPMKSALLAASKRVRLSDIEAPKGVASVLSDAGISVERASSWIEWQQKIKTEAPALLVLLPHSLESLTTPHFPALEISGDTIESVHMDEGYVRCSSLSTPIVLLLGCSNALPQIPFLSVVREFRYRGAAITIGTVATIRGRQTVEFVRELLAELKAAASEERTFDEVFLLVKQRMLANGNPFVLSLVAYGNTGWRIHH